MGDRGGGRELGREGERRGVRVGDRGGGRELGREEEGERGKGNKHVI